MKIEDIFELSEKIFERKREWGIDLTAGEQLLIEACSALKKLQAENKELRDAF